jgi:GDPmannose 4,6-dehydratase
MWMMLQQKKPDDYVIATGKCHTVEDFLKKSFTLLELDYRDYLEIDKTLYRPSEVMVLMGNYSKAERVLGWKPTITFEELIREMVESDMTLYS